MYAQLQQNPQINEIYVVEFLHLKQNENVRTRCVEIFHRDLDDNDYIIYSPIENDIIVLGRFVINESNITSSSMYSSLCDNTTSFYGENYTDKLLQMTCWKIEEWIFDESLKNKTILFQIYSFICRECGEEATILWTEGTEEIIFYPVSKDDMCFTRPSAVSYFTNAFIKE